MSRRLRPEANPVEWNHLSESQREAFRRLMYMLDEAVQALSGPRPWSEDEWLLANDRVSRSAFLDGGRGTGKTTVILSLMKYGFHQSKKPGKKALSPRGFEALNNLCERVVWLEPIDMEPVRDSFNLLAAILTRINESCSRLLLPDRQDNLAGMGEHAGMLSQNTGYLSAIEKLKQLQAEIVLAWNSNLRQRGSQLDPDVYAVEVMRAERAGISLNRKLARTLEEVASELSRYSPVRDPLFVLPIDDFDVDPPSCLQLLRLLRMISMPRLFTLMLGDYDILNLVLNLRISSDFATMASAAAQANLLSIRTDEIAAAAGNVSANSLRKLLPPSQRVELRVMEVHETLNFRPANPGKDDETLHEMLNKCPVYVGRHAVSKTIYDRILDDQRIYDERVAGFGDLLRFRGMPVLKSDKSKEDPSLKDGIPAEFEREHLQDACYSARLMLHTSPRRAADIWFALRRYTAFVAREDEKVREDRNAKQEQLGKKDDTSNPASEKQTLEDRGKPDSAINRRLRAGVVDMIAECCRNTFAEEPVFSPLERHAVQRALTQQPNGEWDWSELPIAMSSVTDHGILHQANWPLIVEETDADSEEWRPQGGFISEIRMRRAMGWRFDVCDADSIERSRDNGVTGTAARQTRLNRAISTDAGGLLILLHDVLAIFPGGHKFKSPLLNLRNPVRETQDWAVTVWRRRPTQRAELHWPVPPCLSVWGLDLFRHTWNNTFAMTEPAPVPDLTPEDFTKTMAFTWISAGCAVSDGKQPTKHKKTPPTRSDWKKLLKRLNDLAGDSLKTNQRHEHTSSWLVYVALLLMPESGLPPGLFDRFDARSPLYEFWAKERRLIRHLRGRRLARLVDGNMKLLAEELLKKVPEGLEDIKNRKTGEEKLGTGLVPSMDYIQTLTRCGTESDVNRDNENSVDGAPTE